MKTILAPLALAVSGFATMVPAIAWADTLTVRVTNVRNTKGLVRIAVCPQAQFLKDDCSYNASAPAVIGTTVVTIDGVPAGRYAVQAFHDENRNGKVDQALFGIPKEGVGFSNDAPIRMSPPKWQDAVIDVTGKAQAITLKMRYMMGPSGPPKS